MQSFFPLDVLDEICDLIESVSEGFLTYSFMLSSLHWCKVTCGSSKKNKSTCTSAFFGSYIFWPFGIICFILN